MEGGTNSTPSPDIPTYSPSTLIAPLVKKLPRPTYCLKEYHKKSKCYLLGGSRRGLGGGRWVKELDVEGDGDKFFKKLNLAAFLAILLILLSLHVLIYMIRTKH